jgi:hypothetical protein
MTLPVTDVRGTAESQIAEAAKALGQSSQRRAVFREIHTGRKRKKTASEIATAISLPRKRVLEEAVKLAHRQIVTQTTYEGEVAYERDNFYYVHRNEILRRANTPTEDRHNPSGSRRPARHVVRGRRARPRAGKRLPRYDLFLCHASEDKVAIARSLYDALRRAGVTVWYDEAVLALGDSLRRKIDEGLSRCRFGLVILSPKFFAKDWPQRELDGLVARENASGQKAIIPVWHHITKSQVAKYSPTLADRLAGTSKDGLRSLVRKIKEVLEASSNSKRRASGSR